MRMLKPNRGLHYRFLQILLASLNLLFFKANDLISNLKIYPQYDFFIDFLQPQVWDVKREGLILVFGYDGLG